jgi:hypothetical protein
MMHRDIRTQVTILLASLFTLISSVSYGQARPLQHAFQRQYYRPVIDIPIDVPKRAEIISKYNEVIRLLNAPKFSPLSPQQIAVLNKVQGIMIVNRPKSEDGTITSMKIFSQSADSVLSYSVNWLATDIIHEGTHVRLYEEGGTCKSAGEEAEREGILAQLELAKNIGLEPGYVNQLNSILRNPITYHRTQRPGGTQLSYENTFILPAVVNIERIDDLEIKKGDTIFVCAEGEMTFGPLAGDGNANGLYSGSHKYQTNEYCFDPTIPHGAVIARIYPGIGISPDNKGWTFVGVSKAHHGFVAPYNGQLQVGFNDRENENNLGGFSFRVMVVKTP